jgi:hypothetical protein
LDQYCTKVAYQERHLPSTLWDAEHRVISVKGKSVDLADIPRAYSAVMERAKSLFEWLTSGINTGLDFPYKSIGDDLENKAPSYSFLSTPILEQSRFLSITHLLQNPKYVVSVEGREVEWSKVAVGQWMKKAEELNHCLLFLIHIGSGQPARGTEILSMLFRNMQNVHRSLFAIPGGLATILGYNKVWTLGFFHVCLINIIIITDKLC